MSEITKPENTEEPAANEIARVERPSAKRYVALGLWFGLLTGFLELLNLAFEKYILQDILLLGRQTIWMAPVSDALVFSVFAALIWLGGRFWPRLFSDEFLFFVLVFLCAASIILLHEEIHTYAALFLSVGIAVQCARMLSKRATRVNALVRRTMPWALLILCGLVIGVPAWQAWREHRAISALPEPAADAPNVLLIVWDTVRSENLSAYGYDRPTTPRLANVAKDGVWFEHPIVTAPWTLPTHASMFTGRMPYELSAGWNVALDDEFPVLAEELSSRGYVTAGFVANYLYCSSAHGLDRGFIHYEDFSNHGTEFILSTQIGREVATSRILRRFLGYHDIIGRKYADQINGDFLGWLDRNQSHPFFVFLNYYDAHDPFFPPEPFREEFGPVDPKETLDVKPDLRRAATTWSGELPEAKRDALENAYDGTLGYLDHCLDKLLNELQKRNKLDNTLVIITSDHGEQFGEHGKFKHGNSLYRALLHVPLVFYFPDRIPRGVRVSQPVSLRDLPATVMDIVGDESPARFPGKTLARHWQEDVANPTDESEAIFAVLEPRPGGKKWTKAVTSVLADGRHYIRFGDGREELYDFLRDPDEEEDLADSPAARAVLLNHRRLVDEIREPLQRRGAKPAEAVTTGQ